jgi:hypothetical protein
METKIFSSSYSILEEYFWQMLFKKPRKEWQYSSVSSAFFYQIFLSKFNKLILFSAQGDLRETIQAQLSF